MSTTPNAALAYDTLDFVTENPDVLDMGSWWGRRYTPGGVPCGTVACYAGWVVARHGDPVVPTAYGWEVQLPDGTTQPIPTRAAHLLHINPTDAGYLFYRQEHELADAVRTVFGPRPDGAR